MFTASSKVQDSGPSNEESCQVKSTAIEMMVSEAVKQVLKENSHLLENFDASKILTYQEFLETVRPTFFF